MPDYQGQRKRVPLRERLHGILGQLPETAQTGLSPLLGGPQGVGILDVLPGTGDALAVDEARDNDTLSTLAILGMFPAGRGAARAARVASEAAQAGRGAERAWGIYPDDRLMRADWMGLSTDAYHGTNRELSGPLRPSRKGMLGPGFYVAENPEVAADYAGDVGDLVIDAQRVQAVDATPQVYPLRIPDTSIRGPGGYFETHGNLGFPDQRYIDRLRSQGYVGIIDVPSGYINVFNPANVRSRFAQFDPAKRGVNDLLASAAPVGMVAAAQDRKQPPRRPTFDDMNRQLRGMR